MTATILIIFALCEITFFLGSKA